MDEVDREGLSLLRRILKHEKKIFYVFYLIGFSVLIYLLVEVYSLQQQERRLHTEYIVEQESALRKRLGEAVSRKRELTLALAVASAESVRVDQRTGKIGLSSSISRVNAISKTFVQRHLLKASSFQIIDSSGINLYRSWSAQKGDHVFATQPWIKQSLKTLRTRQLMDISEKSLVFKVIVPILHKGIAIGGVEVSTSFDSILTDLNKEDGYLVVAIDQKYKSRLTEVPSNAFIDEYFILDYDALPQDIMLKVQGNSIDALVDRHYQAGEQHHQILDDYMVVTGKVKAVDFSEMAHLLFFKKMQDMENELLQQLHDSVFMLLVLIFSMLLFLSLALILRYLSARLHQDKRVYDGLTELRNKIKLMEILDDKRDDHTLVIANVNNFSNINIVYDFDMGDQILKAIALRLKSICQCVEVFRIDADEFGLLYDDDSSAVEMIKNIQRRFFDQEMRFGKHTINITFTYGAAEGGKHLFRKASFSLRQAKNLGSNRYHVYDPGLDRLDHVERKEFLDMSGILHNALESDKVIPYYQGIRDNRTNVIDKFEVLVRIEHNGEILTPYRFIEVAQTTGMITRITQIMIDKAFSYMRNKPYTFSINITEEDLNKNYLITYIQEKLDLYKITPERVTLEILEGVSSGGNKNHSKQFQIFKKMGLKLAIDDFGAEYSNFERVMDLDADFLKIDAKYIKDIDVNHKSYEITKSIAAFAKNTNIICIAEFVASANIQAVIDEFGIEYSQGYYFSEPKEFIVDRKEK